jgi:DNA-binding response OmpR family regulator
VSSDPTAAMPRERHYGALIVDDEEDIRLLVRMAIERWNRGMAVSGEVDHGEAALREIERVDPAVVVIDQMMPDMDGLETARRILALRPDQVVVLFSAFLDEEIERVAGEVGVARCVDKRRLQELPAILHDLVQRN